MKNEIKIELITVGNYIGDFVDSKNGGYLLNEIYLILSAHLTVLQNDEKIFETQDLNFMLNTLGKTTARDIQLNHFGNEVGVRYGENELFEIYLEIEEDFNIDKLKFDTIQFGNYKSIDIDKFIYDDKEYLTDFTEGTDYLNKVDIAYIEKEFYSKSTL